MEYMIKDNKKIKQNYFKLTLGIPPDATLPSPGQFYNIRCSDSKDPLLRRPFSMHRIETENGSSSLEILYRVKGKGTDWLVNRKKGDVLDCIGPLGNGFALLGGATDVLLMARGIGIAPLYAVGEAFRHNYFNTRLHIILSARLGERIFYDDELSKIGKLYICTDDGSQGFHGTGPELLLYLMEENKLPESVSLYACGPDTMLRDLSIIAKRFSMQGQVALETHMACGFGACLTCVIPLRPELIKKGHQWEKPALQWSEDGKTVYALICKDGPIFDIHEVDWDEWLA